MANKVVSFPDLIVRLGELRVKVATLEHKKEVLEKKSPSPEQIVAIRVEAQALSGVFYDMAEELSEGEINLNDLGKRIHLVHQDLNALCKSQESA